MHSQAYPDGESNPGSDWTAGRGWDWKTGLNWHDLNEKDNATYCIHRIWLNRLLLVGFSTMYK